VQYTKNRNRKIPQSEKTQILDLLLRAEGRELSSIALTRITAQYSGLIEDLRLLGFPIRERTEEPDGRVFQYFRLHRSEVQGEVAEALVNCYDIIRRVEVLPEWAWERARKQLNEEGGLPWGET